MKTQSKNSIAAEQLRIVFNSVTLSVCGATLLAAILVVSLNRLGHLDPRTGPGWVLSLLVISTLHAALARFYDRSTTRIRCWPLWAGGFVLCCAAEGIAWGWSSVHLAAGGGFEVGSLTVTATLGVVAGSVPVFSAYLPAFFTFLLPATVPYVVVAGLSANRVQQSTAPMMFLFICVISYLGLLANRTSSQNIRLRLKAEQLAADLLRQKQIAEEANLAKSRFLAAASHDLRQPSHALSLLVGALRGVPMSDEGERIRRQIEMSTDALDKLFSALLDISKLDAGVVEVYRRPFFINAVLDQVCNDFAVDAAAKGVKLKCVRSRAIVDSDPVLLERIVRNLVSNAVRYTESGRILVGCRRRVDGISIEVHDTGCGIPSDQLEVIFQEYYQVGNPERDREKGLGLGLAIVRRLTDLLNCRLTVKSSPGRGSCFCVDVEQSSLLPTQLDAEADETIDTLPASELIVIVDDELAIREAMSKLLGMWGYETIAVASGDEAIARLSTCDKLPDLLICDFRLNGAETGKQVIERLRIEYNSEIPAMLVSGDTSAERLTEANKVGGIMLHKPIPNYKLRAAIGNALATGAQARSRDITD
ncbi:ATP-binding protein [Burkholderia theae]|uniref:ATP-binding protein n=1 Tax=Burkholderia theae TaxID=3143496 RepID=UPI003AFA8790